MLASKGKISLIQALIILKLGMYMPVLRTFPPFAATKAKQAAWISPVIILVVIIPVILIFSSIYKKYREKSFAEVVEDIFGTTLGKMVTILYIAQNTILLTLNTNDFVSRMVTAVYPNVNIMIFYIAMLVLVAFILRKGGIVVFARMSEVLSIMVLVLFLIIFFLTIKNIKISRLTPISPLDVLPVLQTSPGLLSIFAHFAYLFLLGNYINDKENIKKYCIPFAFMQIFLIMLVMIVSIGVLGAPIVEISSYSYLSSVKIISLFKFLDRIDVLVISSWLFSDFVIISLTLLTVLNLFKSLLKLSDTRPLIGIYTIIAFFLTRMIAGNSFELIPFNKAIIIPANIFLGFVVPFLVFVVGKLRKKI